MHNLDLTLSDISKIEGKASCTIKIREGKVEEVKFSIAEYKRFYTAAIRGKDILALPQLTARICGTCSNAHLLCAIKACENALGITVSEQTRKLRKLLNYGLIIRDHGLHLYIFALPDLLNKDSILDFDVNNKLEHKLLDDTFAVKAAGNNLSLATGGRSVHAPYPTVGRFSKLPSLGVLKSSISELEKIRPKVVDLIEIFAAYDTQLKRDDLQFTAVVNNDYSFIDGDILTSNGKKESQKLYGEHLQYVDIAHSHASGYRFDGKTYMVGALARINLAQEKLHPNTKQIAAKYLKLFPSNNIFHNNLAQAIEILHAIDASLEILKTVEIVDEKPQPIVRKSGIGIAAIEAPRGTLYYNLEVDANGKIIKGQIIVPTGQNQIGIEESVRQYLEKNIDNDIDEKNIEHNIERIVRAYDPCMSCASHFLKVKWL